MQQLWHLYHFGLQDCSCCVPVCLMNETFVLSLVSFLVVGNSWATLRDSLELNVAVIKKHFCIFITWFDSSLCKRRVLDASRNTVYGQCSPIQTKLLRNFGTNLSRFEFLFSFSPVKGSDWVSTLTQSQFKSNQLQGGASLVSSWWWTQGLSHPLAT